jgi:membrane-bound serine protease (ClpP class)
MSLRAITTVLLTGLLATWPAMCPAQVNLIAVRGSINPAVDDFIRESLRVTKDGGAEALVIELDTPGGLLTSAKSIVTEMLGAEVPVIVYVSPAGASATSAGVFVTLAAHLAVMAPATTIGAAHPVDARGGSIGGDMREKVENSTVSFIQSIAERRGRNAQWAEDAVRKSVSITEQEAVNLNVVDLIAPDLRSLLAQAAGRQVRIGGTTVTLGLGADTAVTRLEMRLKQRVLNLIADPNIAYLLFLAGLLGLYFELANPGVVFPGVIGGICLLLALAAFQVLPINATGALLLLFALALILAEAFVPSFGVLGVGGIAAFALGSLLLFDSADPTAAVDRSIIASAVVAVSVFMLTIGYLVLRTQRRPAITGAEGLVGERGIVRRRVEGEGLVFVHGEYWTVVSDETLEVGESVEIVRVEPRMRLRVRRAPSLA